MAWNMKVKKTGIIVYDVEKVYSFFTDDLSFLIKYMEDIMVRKDIDVLGLNDITING